MVRPHKDYNLYSMYNIHLKQRWWFNMNTKRALFKVMRAITMHYFCIYGKTFIRKYQKCAYKCNVSKVIAYTKMHGYTVHSCLTVLSTHVFYEAVDFSNPSNPVTNDEPLLRFTNVPGNKATYTKIELNNSQWNFYLPYMKPNPKVKCELVEKYEKMIEDFWESHEGGYEYYKKTGELGERKYNKSKRKKQNYIQVE